MQGDFAVCRSVSRSVQVTSQPGAAGTGRKWVRASLVSALHGFGRHVSLSKVSLLWTTHTMDMFGREEIISGTVVVLVFQQESSVAS
jgi:hypothetical protein